MNFKKELKIFLSALCFYTRIPCYKISEYSEEYLSKTSRYYPLIGLIIGIIGAITYLLFSLILPSPIAILFSMISTVLVTGAFQEDGFGDYCDGFGGGYTKEQILAIMKDSRVGSYGVLGILFIILMKFITLTYINPFILPLIIISGHTVSRFIAISFMYSHNYARKEEDQSKSIKTTEKLSLNGYLFALLTALIPLLILGLKVLIVLLPLYLVKIIMGRQFTKRLGGYTGDCLGAVQQVSELVFYIFILGFLWKFI